MRYKIVIPLFALLLCFCMTACASKMPEDIDSTDASSEDRQITVKAGDIVFYADQVQRDLNVLIEDYELAGKTLTEEERAAAAQEIVDDYVIRALTKARLKKLGLDKPDENTLYEMRSAAQKSYDEYWQKFRDLDASADYTDDELTVYLEENGVNIDYFFDTLQTEYEMRQLADYYKININISENEIDSFYKENYVDPSRERYENNIPLFEEEVISGGGDSAYVPEGFRILHQIVIPVPDKIRSELTQIESEADAAAKEAEDAYNKIAQLAIDGKSTSQQTEIYRTAMDRIDELNVEYGKLWQSVLTATADECDELYARMLTGESFEDLMKLYDPNNTLIYHAKSQRWSEELMAGAATLKEKGDISQPTLCADGVHILCYYDDIPAGEARLENEEDRSMLRELLVQQRTREKVKKLVEPWGEEFGLVTDLSTLNY